jgi:hypothetical protein
MTSTISCTARGIESGDIWQAMRRHGLYYRSDAELEALMARCHLGQAVDRVTAEAARHVRNLRRELAAGGSL